AALRGGPREEQLLHEQFARYRLKGEWFRRSPSLLRVIKKLLLRMGKPSTVSEECERRDCRHGLKGVEVALLGTDEIHKIYYSMWGHDKQGNDKQLLLTMYPIDGPEPQERYPPNSKFAIKGIILASEVLETDWPAGSRRNVPADRCLLLSEWPDPQF